MQPGSCAHASHRPLNILGPDPPSVLPVPTVPSRREEAARAVASCRTPAGGHSKSGNALCLLSPSPQVKTADVSLPQVLISFHRPDLAVTFGWILLIASKVVRAGQTMWSQILDFFGKYPEYLLFFTA